MDSDSDSSDAGSFTTTNVLLGYASKEATDDSISQLGGHPSFLDPARPPSAALARCSACRNLMPQLLQLHADLPDRFAGHERRLHVWACRRKACARKPGSVRALRSTRAPAAASASAFAPPPPAASPPAPAAPAPPMPAAPSPAPALNLGSSIFGGGAAGSSGSKLFGAPPAPAPAPASMSTPAAPPPDLSATFAAKARLSADPAPSASTPTSPDEPWPAALPAAYPTFFLDADYEELDGPSDAPSGSTSSAAAALPDFDDPTLSGPSAKVGAKDDFESSLDRTFQRFADRLAQNPEQVLRYEFAGAALLYSRHDAAGAALASVPPKMPRCERCGAARVFELQLVPHAIVELEGEDGPGADGMEWGTIVLGVCGADCAGERGEVVNVSEWAGVQWEEQGRK